MLLAIYWTCPFCPLQTHCNIWPETVILVAVAWVIGLFGDIFTSNTTSGDLRITLSQEETLGTRSRNSDLLMPARQSLGSPNAFVTVIYLSLSIFIISQTVGTARLRSQSIFCNISHLRKRVSEGHPKSCSIFVGNRQTHVLWAVFFNPMLCRLAHLHVRTHLNNLQPWPSHIIG